MNLQLENFKRLAFVSLFLITLAGIILRFYHITQNQFFYYDEGLWLNEHLSYIQKLNKIPTDSFPNFFQKLRVISMLALTEAKALWFWVINLRVFFGGADAWYFSRMVSAVFGVLTLGVAYLFAKRYFGSRGVALLSVAILALLPSHLYYSRLGLQESLSTFLLLSGLYLYLFDRDLTWKVFASGFIFSLVFFSNYRLIVLPVLVGFCEVFMNLAVSQRPNFRKYLWNTLTFLCIIILIGNLGQGANAKITFGWIFHQAELAQGGFDVVNFLSYPYYTFRLESLFFAILFFGNIYFVFQKQWSRLLPFALACLQMFIFSFAQEKGVRYLCVVMPMMAMAAASLIEYWLKVNKNQNLRLGILVLTVAMFINHAYKAGAVVNFHSDYETSVNEIRIFNPSARILSSQEMIQSLYVDDKKNVRPIPTMPRYFLLLYLNGYKYLVLDPQAYISLTQDGHRFNVHLIDYLEFIKQYVKPVKSYAHFDEDLLERFVLEHNENLFNSIKFIKTNEALKGQLGELYLYDIEQCIAVMKTRAHQPALPGVGP